MNFFSKLNAANQALRRALKIRRVEAAKKLEAGGFTLRRLVLWLSRTAEVAYSALLTMPVLIVESPRRRERRMLSEAVRASMEMLEPRMLMTGVLSQPIIFVNDDWQTVSGNTADTFSDDDGALSGLTLNTNAFTSVQQALASGHVTDGTKIVVVSGNYGGSEMANVTIGNVTIEGWQQFAQETKTAGTYSGPGTINFSKLNPSLLATLNGGMYTLNATGDVVEGMNVTHESSTGGIAVGASGTNFLIQGNTFSSDDAGVVVSHGTGNITGNNFDTTVGTYIINTSGGEIAALSNVFAGVNTGAATTLAQNYAIDDKITDGLDDPSLGGSGLVRIEAGNVYVTQSSGSIQRGVNLAVAGNTVDVQAGTFKENVTISKALTLDGADAGIAGANASGNTPTRTAASETDVVTNGNQLSVFTISSGNVTIDGFTVDGDDPSVTGASLTSGDDTNVEYGIHASSNFSNLTIQNDVIKHAEIGFRGDGSASNNLITNNWFDSIGVFDFGYAVTLRTNFYANVTNNLMTRVQSGVQSNNFSGATGPATWTVAGNTIEAYGAGIWDNLQYNGATSMTIQGNTISSLVAPATPANALVRSNFDNQTVGIFLVSIQDNVGVTLANNNISGMAYGVTLYNTSTNNTITIDGTNTICNNGVGVFATNIVAENPVSRTELGGDPSNVPAGFTGPNNPTGTAKVILNGVTLTNNTTGVEVNDANAFVSVGATVTLENGTTITGGTTGLLVNGNRAAITGNTLADTEFSDQSGNYVALTGGALSGSTLDGSTASYDGVAGDAASVSAAFGIEDKIADYLDTPGVGYVSLNSGEVYVTQLSETTTAGAIQRGLNVAAANATENIQAGNFAGGINVSNPVSIVGAGSDAATGTVISSASGNIVTVASGNVSMSGLRVSGDTSGYGISFDSTVGNVSISNVASVGNGSGIEIHNSAVVTNLTLTNVSLTGDTDGFRVSSTGVVNGLTVTGSHFDNDQYGLYTTGTSGSTTNQTRFNNISISSSTFNNDLYKGIYAEVLNNAILNGVTVDGSGYGATSPNGINLNLKYGTYGNITIENSSFDSDGTGNVTDGALDIEGRNDHSYSSNPASLSGVTLTGDTFTGNSPVDLILANNITGVTMSNVSLGGTGVGLGYQGTAAGLNVGNTSFAGTLGTYIANGSTFAIDATNDATFSGFDSGAGSVPADLASYYATEDKIVDAVDQSGLGLVRLKAGHVFVTPNSFVTPAVNDSGSIQRGINAATAGDTVNVEAGTYLDQLSITKNVTVIGAGNSTVIQPATLSSEFGSAGARGTYPIVFVNNANVTLQAFTIDGTNAGNAYADGFTGMTFLNAGGTVDHVTIENIENSPFNGVQNGLALYASNADAVSRSLTVTNNVINTYQKNGITLSGSGLSVDVEGNTVTGNGNTTQIASNGIEIASGAGGTVAHNTVSGNEYSGGLGGPDFLSDQQSTGILIIGASATLVSDNTVDANDIGIYSYAPGAIITVSGNTLGNTTANRYAGIAVDESTTTVSDNAITGGNVGLLVVSFAGSGGNSSAAVTGNTIDGAGTGLELLKDTSGPNSNQPVLTSFSGNTFDSDSFYIANDNATTLNLSAVSNSFDGVDPSTAGITLSQYYNLEDKISDQLDNPNLGYVELQPGDEYLTPTSDATTPGAIERGIGVAANGDTVHIESGSYTGDVDTGTKGLTVEADPTPGDISITGNVALHSGDTLRTTIDGVSAGTFDVLSATGNVSLGGAQLDTSESTVDGVQGQSVQIISAGGTVSGTFAGIGNQTVINVDGHAFEAFYNTHNVTLARLSDAVKPPAPGAPGVPPPGPTTVYVSSSFTGPDGTDGDGSGPGTAIGYDEFSDIQAALNAVAPGGEVDIAAGTFDPSNILINIPVTISGAGEGMTIITPSETDSHDDSSFGGTASNGFIIASSNVTIENLSLDGGANQDFRDAIITNSQNDGHTYGNITIQNVGIENVFRKGIALYNLTGIAPGQDVISNVTLSNVGTIINDGGAAYEGTAAIAVFGANALIENNTITNSAGGILGNTFDGSALQLTIEGNHISAPETVLAKGALGIDVASLAGGSVVSGNPVNLTGGTGNDLGIVVSFDHGNVTVGNNTITAIGNDDGIVLYQDASPVTLTDNPITSNSGHGTGILVTAAAADTRRFGDVPGAVSATLLGNTVSGFGTAVAVNCDGAAGDTATVNIGDGTAGNSNSLSAANVGVSIDGSLASVTINDDSITAGTAGSGTGVELTSGNLTLEASSVSGFGSGVEIDGGNATVGGNVAQGNQISNNGFDVTVNGAAGLGTVTVSNNTITDTTSDNTDAGLVLISISGTAPTISDNTINGADVGVFAWNNSTPLTISGGTIENATDSFNNGQDVLITNDNPSSATEFSTIDESVTLDGVTLEGNDFGVQVLDAASVFGHPGGNVSVGFTGNTTISDVQQAIMIDGAKAGVVGDTLGNTSITNASDAYIELTDGAMNGQTLDATAATLGASLPGARENDLADAYAAEDKITDYLDGPGVGYVKLENGQTFVAHSSEAATPGAIQRGINKADTGGTVNVQTGTFVGEITIDKSLKLEGAQFGDNPNTSAPAADAQTIIEPDTSGPDPFTTDLTVITVTSGNVAIEGVTVEGDNPNITSGVTQNGADIDAGEAIATLDTNGSTGNITVTDDIIKDFSYAGVDLGADYNGGAATSDSTVSDNKIDNLGGGGFGYGIGVLLYNNQYAQVTSNDITNARVGIQTGNFYTANPDSAFVPEISDNTISANRRGIYDNLFYDTSSAFTVDSNSISALDDPTAPGNAVWIGILISSLGTAGQTATFTNNTITQAGPITQPISASYAVWNTDPLQNVTISGGSVSGSLYGVWVSDSVSSNNTGAPNSHAEVSGVSISATDIGVYDDNDPARHHPSAVSVIVDGNTTITGGVTGIFVNGASATISNVTIGDPSGDGIDVASGNATISHDHIYGNAVGVEVASGGSASLSDNNFDGGSSPDNTTDLKVDSGAISVTTTADSYAATTTFIDNESALNIDASTDSFKVGTSKLATSLSLPDAYAVEDKITDYLDNPADGYVELQPNDVYVTQKSENTTAEAIQRGINVSSTGGNVHVTAGTFEGQLVITHGVTLSGANAGADPTHNGTRGAETVVEPSVSGANPYAGTHTFLVEVLASNVTIDGFTFTGQNSSLPDANGVALTETGATPIISQAVEGIVAYDPTGIGDVSANSSEPGTPMPSNVHITNNIIEDLTYQGVDMGWGTSGAVSTGDTISHNVIQNIGAYNDEGSAIRLYNNFYADVTSNQIINTRMGIELGNFYSTNTGSTGSIEDNDITVRRRGIFYNLFYSDASSLPVMYNTIDATADDPAIVANASLWTGIYLISQNGTATANFFDNSIDGSGSSYATTAGYTILNTWSSDDVEIGGDANPLNSITNVTYGVWETSGDPNGFGAASTQAMGVTISGLHIAASQAGILVEDSATNSGHPAVSATITGNTTITGGNVGIETSGANASVTVSNTTISDPTEFAVLINGGHGNISNSSIYDNGTGIDFTNGGSGSFTGVDFDNATLGPANTTDVEIDANAGTVTDGGANTFAGATFIQNLKSGLTIDATHDFFTAGNFTAVAAANLMLWQEYAVEDQIDDYLDTPGEGNVTLRAGNVYVTQKSENTTAGAIARGIDVAASGDTVHVQAGTYAGPVDINKSLTLSGAGSTVTGTIVSLGSSDSLSIDAGNVSISGLRVVGNSSTYGIYFNSAVANVTLSNVVSTGSGEGIEIHNSGNVTNLTLTNVSLTGDTVGFRTSSTGVVNGLTVTGSHFDNDQYGLYTTATSSSTTNQNSFNNISISSSTFNNDLYKGIYAEVMNNAILDGLTVDSTGSGASSPNGINLNLKYGTYGNITIANSSFDSDATGNAADGALDIEGRNDHSYTSNPASLSGVTLTGDTFTGTSPVDLILANNITGVTMSNVSLGGAGVGLGYQGTAGGLNVGNTSFAGTLTTYIANGSPFAIDATNDATFNGFDTGAGSTPADLASYYATEDKIIDAVDAPGLGLVRLHSKDVFVTPNSFNAALGTTTPSIQRGINAATAGDTVFVEAGTYTGDVNVNKSITLDGAGAGANADGRSISESIIQSPANGSTELTISASDATVDGFTIQGNTNDNLVGYGVYITPGVSGTHLDNNIIQDNIAGLALANASATDQAQIEGNLFQNNNNPGSAQGTDIYADQYTAGATLQNVLISDNTFTNSSFVEDGWGIGMSNTGATPTANITVSGNTFSNLGRGMYFFNADNITITGNDITGATHYAVGLFGDTDTNFDIGANTLDDNGTGIEITNEDTGASDVTGLDIHNNYIDDNNTGLSVDGTIRRGSIDAGHNSFAGNIISGLYNDSTVTVDASANWWGSVSGPTTPLNTYATVPGLPPTGDAVTGSGDTIIVPWYTSGAHTAQTPGFYPVGPLDTTAPAQPSQPTLDPASDTGASDSDGITKDNTPTFTGTAEAGATVTLYDTDGTTVLGTATADGTGNWSITSSALSNGAHTLTVIATDQAGNQSDRSNQDSVDIDTLNPAPSITDHSTAHQENTPVVLSGAANDPSPTFGSPTYLWTVSADNGQVIANGTDPDFNFTPNDNGNYTVTLQVTDAAGNTGSTTDIIDIANVAPSNVNLALTSSDINENGSTDLSGNFTDPGTLDTHTVDVSWGDGSADTIFGLAAGVTSFDAGSHTYLDNPASHPNGSFPIHVTVTDNDGASGNASTSVEVDNVAPSNVQITPSSSDISENGSIGLSGSFTDPGTKDSHTIDINWGDGSPDTIASLAAGVTTFDNLYHHTYLNNPAGQPDGNYAISVTVTDKDGASASGNSSVEVDNVAPSNINLSLTSGDINENGTTDLSGNFTDPGTLDTHQVDVNWGDGSADTILNLGAGVTTFDAGNHQYLNNPAGQPNGSFPISVTVTDSDNATGNASTSVEVDNVAPSNVNLHLSSSDINENGSTDLSGNFTDPGTLDTHTVDVSWGDGSADTILNLSAGVTTFDAGSHQYRDNPTGNATGSFPISVTVTDSGNATGNASTSVEVDNVAPSNVNLHLSSGDINENGTTDLTGNFTDPGTLDTHTVDVSWGDGSADTILHLSAGVTSFDAGSHTYLDNPTGNVTGSFPISVTITDKDGGVGSGNTAVEVDNVAPSNLNLHLSSSSINENGSTDLTGNFTDPGTRDTHQVDVNWGDGSADTAFTLAAGVTIFDAGSHTYLDNPAGHPTGNFPISVTVTDKDGAAIAGNSSVSVANVAPSNVNLHLSSSDINENGSTDLTGNFTDPGTLDTHTIDVNWGDGSADTVFGLATGVTTFDAGSHTYLNNPPGQPNGSYPISVTITDKDGGVGSGNTSVEVDDVAPTIALSGNATTNEGSVYTLNLGAITDPGTEDVVTSYKVNWGDGTATQSFSGNPANTTLTHTYGDGPASDTIRVTLIDNDGQHNNAGTLSVGVVNVAPTATVTNDGTVDEGDSTQINVSNIFDPSSADLAAGIHIAYDFNDDGTFDVGNGTYAGSPAATANENVPTSFLTTPGVHTVDVRVIDKDGGHTDYLTSFNVDNVAPIVNLVPTASASAGSVFNFSGSFTDPGNDTPWTGVVNYGDGTGNQPLTVDSTDKTFSLSHTYASSGNFTISVAITDTTGQTGPEFGPLTGTGSMNVTVQNTTLRVLSTTTTGNGFDIQFNRAVDISDIALYGSGNVTSPITVQLGNTTVAGSLVWDSGTNTAHWIKTGGNLATGNYTLTLASGTTGDNFHDASNNALDGNSDNTPGDNYVDAISVNNPVVVSVPSFARGPDQQVITNQNGIQTGSTGLPLMISDGTGVQSVHFVINYDPTLLNINTQPQNISVPSGFTYTINSNTLGHLDIVVFATGTSTLGSGQQTFLTFKDVNVPDAAPVGAAEAITFTNLLLNEHATSPIASIGAEGLHKVVDLGDTTDSGIVGSQDAFNISRVVVHLDTGFAADPLVNPIIIGDLTGDGTLSGLDATAASLMSTNSTLEPQVPNPVFISGGAVSPLDPTVQSGNGNTTTIETTVGSNVIANISINDNANGLTSADLVITYDPSLLSLSDANVQLSSQLSSLGWGFTESVVSPGTLNVGLFSTSTPLTTGPAQLLQLTFQAGNTDGVSQLGIAPGKGNGLNKGALPMTTDVGSITINSTVTAEHVFYAGSLFDQSTDATNPDDNAIATDKSALLPGQTATFANYTSYSDGLNGIMIDIAGTVGSVTAADFGFRVGGTGLTGNDLSTWTTLTGPAPIVTTRPTPGVPGSTRVELVFQNNEIENEWLEITVLTTHTGLAANTVFYFGNAIGETGDSTTNAKITANDEILTRSNPANFQSAPITSPYDFNRDGNVNAQDQILARSNVTTNFTALDLISPPANSSPTILTAGISSPSTAGSGSDSDSFSPMVVLPTITEDLTASDSTPTTPPSVVTPTASYFVIDKKTGKAIKLHIKDRKLTSTTAAYPAKPKTGFKVSCPVTPPTTTTPDDLTSPLDNDPLQSGA